MFHPPHNKSLMAHMSYTNCRQFKYMHTFMHHTGARSYAYLSIAKKNCIVSSLRGTVFKIKMQSSNCAIIVYFVNNHKFVCCPFNAGNRIVVDLTVTELRLENLDYLWFIYRILNRLQELTYTVVSTTLLHSPYRPLPFSLLFLLFWLMLNAVNHSSTSWPILYSV